MNAEETSRFEKAFKNHKITNKEIEARIFEFKNPDKFECNCTIIWTPCRIILTGDIGEIILENHSLQSLKNAVYWIKDAALSPSYFMEKVSSGDCIEEKFLKSKTAEVMVEYIKECIEEDCLDSEFRDAIKDCILYYGNMAYNKIQNLEDKELASVFKQEVKKIEEGYFYENFNTDYACRDYDFEGRLGYQMKALELWAKAVIESEFEQGD